MTSTRTVLCINTHGKGGQDEIRTRKLTSTLDAEITFYDIDKKMSKAAANRELWNLLQSKNWDLVYQEGTGIAGGLNLIKAAMLRKQRYIVSSGDPVGGFFHATKGPVAGRVFDTYERLLYSKSVGFIGWTPYLTGAAIKLGAPQSATIEGAVDLAKFTPLLPAERAACKTKLGLNPDHLVCGVVGSLRWSERQKYSYGLELVECLKRLKREDVSMLIVGDGTGKEVLEKMTPDNLRSRIVFTGRLPQDAVVSAMNAMDIGFITQTLDQLGTFRLTTKLPEYLACGVAVAMSPIPGFYDYVSDAGWALPVGHPADSKFHSACAAWLDKLSREDVADKASHARKVAEDRFDYEMIARRFSTFVTDILEG